MLRAKILYAKGVFKRTNSLSKVERRVKRRTIDDMMRDGAPDGAMQMVFEPACH
ncbi:hypothetical protein KQH49_10510 [Mycetohabitans sp. B5]|uniref:Uncharacterized protein n=1 Tax=Mycetohabitans endofungorum TaxID=417203 RepID=A0A2P5K890_9BURK|nr:MULTISPECIES: hypothetical protein [Mycetohabitans]MCG1055347.1 hypothetical protein [Mycetohabitans sp. B5]PPB82936.1 hypothetical protein B0O95_112113 [Mycetohabitans endofungorum]